MDDDPPYAVGYGRPPKATQFPKNTTGNARGAPKGPRKKTLPHEAVLGRDTMIVEDGFRRTVRADEAFLHYLLNQGLKKEGHLRVLAVQVFEKARCQTRTNKPRIFILTVYPKKGEVGKPMRALGMAHLLDPCRPTAKLVVESWLVQSALSRLGDRRFTISEQETIIAATRKPHTVKWPSWWEVKPG